MSMKNLDRYLVQIALHSFLAMLPFMIGSLRQEWYVPYVLVINIVGQALICIYKIRKINRSQVTGGSN